MDELHYLQTRLVSSQLYVDKLEVDIDTITIREKALEEQLEVLSKHNKNLQIQNEEYIQQIDLLQHNLNVCTANLQQIEPLVQTARLEKEMILKDLHKLQQQNQELNEQHTTLMRQRQTVCTPKLQRK